MYTNTLNKNGCEIVRIHTSAQLAKLIQCFRLFSSAPSIYSKNIRWYPSLQSSVAHCMELMQNQEAKTYSRKVKLMTLWTTTLSKNAKSCSMKHGKCTELARSKCVGTCSQQERDAAKLYRGHKGGSEPAMFHKDTTRYSKCYRSSISITLSTQKQKKY